MSLANNLKSSLPTSGPVNSLTAGDAPSALQDSAKQLHTAGEGLTQAHHLPGEYPTDENQKNERGPDVSFPPLSEIPSRIWGWIKGFFPVAVDWFESLVQRLVLKLLPPPRQAAMYEAALSHPIAASFLVCQLICCGVPILVFVAGTCIVAAVAFLLWAVLSLLILGPILLVASMMGLSLWGWGWVVFGLVKWTDRLFLHGMLSRLWASEAAQYREELKASEGKADPIGDHKDAKATEKECSVESRKD